MSSIRSQFAETKVAHLAPLKKVSLINKLADNAALSPNQLIDVKREEIKEFEVSKGKKLTPAAKAKLAQLQLELFGLRHCYHTMLQLRKAKKAKRSK